MKRTILSLVTAALLAATALSACSDKSDPPLSETLAEILEEKAPLVTNAKMPADTPEPAGYQIGFDRYALPDPRKPERLTRAVTRPFSETVGASVRSLGFQADSADADSRVVLLRPVPNDQRPRVYPPVDAPERFRRVLGQTCRDYRVGKASYCVNSNGVVLASNDGTRVEIARHLQLLEPPAPPSELTSKLAGGFNDPNRGSLRPIDPTASAPGAIDWSLPRPPAGFTLVGRYAVVALTAAVLARNNRKIAAGIVDVYVRGIDSVIVDRGGRLDSSDVTDEDLGPLTNPREVELGELGAGQVGIGGLGPFSYREVRAVPAKGRYVVVAGTLPADELVTLARSLQPKPGTSLKYLDGH